ncbi:MAG TPA: hypothetical protein PK863_01735 [Candidatus Dojkabacteria bacterium]|nr:hypothetical protein [Candidatus Dojkabacteria bacterium]HRP50818.1 hypothetical protein [Candidatus Dojkabacteria bacterium]
MIEKHILGNFIPKDIKYIILGSFYSKGLELNTGYDWYYGSKYNQLWRILEGVYGVPLKDKNSKINLFNDLKIGFADVIESCERKHNNSSDSNLVNITHNYSIVDILNESNLLRVFFTSAFVENTFNKFFSPILDSKIRTQFVRLPSPSPRYARISLEEKVRIYKQLLPKIVVN